MCRICDRELKFADESSWQDALGRWQLTDERHVRIVTEGAVLASVLSHGVSPDLAVISDDAGQFRVLCHALCWIHAERLLAKLVGFNDEQHAALERIRGELWALYRQLKQYKAAPAAEASAAIEKRFDELCATSSLASPTSAETGTSQSFARSISRSQ
jgi:hypothetical protein